MGIVVHQDLIRGHIYSPFGLRDGFGLRSGWSGECPTRI
jgi:hypothetical protein